MYVNTCSLVLFFMLIIYYHACFARRTLHNREAMGKSASVLSHDESEGRPSVEAVPDELRAQVAAGQCVAIRGESRNELVPDK